MTTIKKFIPIAVAATLFWMFLSSVNADTDTDRNELKSLRGEIKRLTFSGNNIVEYPCLDDSGGWMLYTIEIKDGDETVKAVRIMNLEDGEVTELFLDGQRKALAPYEDAFLYAGSKPPVLSGNGKVAVFSLSVGEPFNILDHYLAVIKNDGSDFWLTSFPIDALAERDLNSLDFTSADWERLSNYAVSSDGSRIACALKGHLGPSRYGNPSGLVFIDAANRKKRTILAPEFNGKEWEWPSFPRSPLTGGGWAFCMSGNGQRIVFGAQSSSEKIDYDLYVTDWDGQEIKKITDFHDRWFSLADISHDGKRIVFFYNGSKKQGIGTYSINSDGTGLKLLESRVAERIELFDMSGDGRFVLFKHIYKGMILELPTGQEMVAFDESTPGYVQGLIPMDFPRIPAFWLPRIVSFNGERVLLVGPPKGKQTPEIYLLRMDRS
jgi:hypothetical protein